MSDVQPETAGVQAQYAARVAADLEINRKEQERVGAEVSALQEQLQALENDHAVLLSMQQALGSPGTPATAAKKAAPRKKAVPAPRASANNARGANARTAKSRTARSKTPVAAKGKDKATTAAPKASGKQPAVPTLVELIDNHLGQHNEPRSAAEITTALTQAVPDRTIKTTVVRTTVEGLVAKGRVQRTKQGSSVFYTAAAPAEQSASPQPEASAS
ncbi:BlaI/MecI/CopY family transcriptional regulator [Streptomyces sp. NPDC004732]|uniref:BlaI/MecI/CopY family transcriptional regulator n=1 Tax=Streptomyces sp. NPDC004732 TaxID=3154290 RepID=UPI0033A31E46